MRTIYIVDTGSLTNLIQSDYKTVISGTLLHHTCFELEKMVTNRINGFRPEQYTTYNVRHYVAYINIRCTAPSDIPLTESKTWSRFLILRVSFFSKIRPFYTAVCNLNSNKYGANYLNWSKMLSNQIKFICLELNYQIISNKFDLI